MIVVHHLENSRSQRILWLLEELGLPYEVRRYARDAKTSLAPPALAKVHPLGKSPVITEGAVTVAETGAIIEYLVDKADGALRPAPGTADHRRYTYWMHYAEGSAMPALVMALVFHKIRSAPMPFFARPIAKAIVDNVMADFVQPNLDRNLDFMEGELGDRGWFAGRAFSAADVMMSFPVEAALSQAGGAARAPHLAAFLDKVRARPAWQRALERGGPYALLG
jgi:glutathione S-transferase